MHSDTQKTGLAPRALADLIVQSLDTDKAFDIVTIEMDKSMALADHMIIASGTSARHVGALASKLKDTLAKEGIKPIKLEGQTRADWVVLDAGDVIVHIFRPEVRTFYDIEKMWNVPGPVPGDSAGNHQAGQPRS